MPPHSDGVGAQKMLVVINLYVRSSLPPRQPGWDPRSSDDSRHLFLAILSSPSFPRCPSFLSLLFFPSYPFLESFLSFPRHPFFAILSSPSFPFIPRLKQQLLSRSFKFLAILSFLSTRAMGYDENNPWQIISFILNTMLYCYTECLF